MTVLSHTDKGSNSSVVSIITVSLNNANTISETIASINRQAYPNIEHIIIDGSSTDGTYDIIINSEKRPGPIVSEPDGGIYDAMNKGISLASGDIVGILNADDFYASSESLTSVVDVFSDPTVDACYGDLLYVHRTDITHPARLWRSRPYRDGLFYYGWYPPHPTFFVRKCWYDNLGSFDLSLSMANDIELIYRFIGLHHIRSVHIPEILVHMRLGGTSNKNLRSIIHQNLCLYQALRKNNIPHSRFFPILKTYDRLLQIYRARFGSLNKLSTNDVSSVSSHLG